MKNADAVVGAPIEAGCIVTRRSGVFAKVGVQAVAGVAGQLVKDAHEQRSTDVTPEEGWTNGYLARTADELVLLRTKTGLLGPKPGTIIARAPRAAVRRAVLGSGSLSVALDVELDGDVTWALDVPRAHTKKARATIEPFSAA